jgi:hypothetical protein
MKTEMIQIDMFPELFFKELVSLTEQLSLSHHNSPDQTVGAKCRHGFAPSYKCQKCQGELEYED